MTRALNDVRRDIEQAVEDMGRAMTTLRTVQVMALSEHIAEAQRVYEDARAAWLRLESELARALSSPGNAAAI